MHTTILSRLQLESDLRQALTRQEFLLHYQPIVELSTLEWIGFEALIRWYHPQRGMISPNEFIPLAEETGFILPLGQWVLQEACRQIQRWHEQFPQFAHWIMSVNLSGKQLRSPDFLAQVDDILRVIEINPRFIKLELTESMLIEDVDSMLATLYELHQRGIQLSIDDFGTGYSSLSYLPRFPIKTIKTDRSFVQRMTQDAENLEIVRAIITLAHSLNLRVIAEGIESPEQLECLRSLQCKYGQGYLFAKPMSATTITELLLNPTYTLETGDRTVSPLTST